MNMHDAQLSLQAVAQLAGRDETAPPAWKLLTIAICSVACMCLIIQWSVLKRREAKGIPPKKRRRFHRKGSYD